MFLVYLVLPWYTMGRGQKAVLFHIHECSFYSSTTIHLELKTTLSILKYIYKYFHHYCHAICNRFTSMFWRSHLIRVGLFGRFNYTVIYSMNFVWSAEKFRPSVSPNYLVAKSLFKFDLFLYVWLLLAIVYFWCCLL